MAPPPRDRAFDNTLRMLADPYRFVSTLSAQLGSDVIETRLMFRKAVCALGDEAARVFYHPDRFTRRGAIPLTALLLLQDRGSAATLDAEAHRHRKRMLMSLMTPDRVQSLADGVAESWRQELGRWECGQPVTIAHEVPRILCRAVCWWAGVPLEEAEVERRTRELVAMYEGAGAVGPRNWRGQLLRARTERWARRLVRRIRTGDLAVPRDTAVYIIACHRDLDGKLLPAAHAAVELINLLRPTVAVERFVTFAALALHEHPESRARLSGGDEPEYLDWFVQEVRRFYPFFPLVGGRARMAFEWRGHSFAKGTWMLLDLYGTDHDPRSWERPDAFWPERFRNRDVSVFSPIPQGGGDPYVNHRCAGEWITIEIMKRAVRLLTTEMRYEVPAQDLTIDMSRLPAVPRSRFVISNVKRVRSRHGAPATQRTSAAT
jgi:fatty-acid peroxygenase